jgi:hypothetical protein
MVADLGALRGEEDGDGTNSVNAGIAFYDEDRLRKLRLPSPASFGEWVGMLQTSGVPIRVGRTDWKRCLPPPPAPCAGIRAGR